MTPRQTLLAKLGDEIQDVDQGVLFSVRKQVLRQK